MNRDLFEDIHQEFRQAVQVFIDRELVPHAVRHREEKSFGRRPWLQAGKQGFLGFMMPERFGGSGQNDFRFNVVFAEELAVLGYGYASAFGINVDVVSPYLRDLTTEEQKERWLPRFCAGEMITAIAMTEPGTGSDLLAISSTATRCEGGWVLNGAKTFITNGAIADLIIVAAKTDPSARSKDISLLVLENGAGGFTRGKPLEKVGQPEVDATELFFSDVFVPNEDVLGEPGNGFSYIMHGLAQERLSASVAAVADAIAVFETTIEYAKQRQAFGQAIGSFQHNRFLLATMSTELDVTRAWVDRCIAAHVQGILDPADAAKAKYWATEVQNRVIDGCVQMFGGYGYIREQRVARAWMDARITRIFAGTNEIMREVIGRNLGL